MGNVRATVDPSGNVQYQVYDAFGLEMGGGTLMKCNPTSQRMLAGGRAQWRGAEGSQTDINAAPIEAVTPPVYGADNWPTSHESYSRKTSGLVFMQNRFYQPATGRFTQADPMAMDLVSLSKAQNNRWVYCANDPVNMTDPTGLSAEEAIVFGALLVSLAFITLLGSWVMFTGFLLGAVAGFFFELAQQLKNPCVDWGEVFKSAAVGGVFGAIFPGVAGWANIGLRMLGRRLLQYSVVSFVVGLLFP